MDMGFAVICPPATVGLVSGSCSSARVFAHASFRPASRRVLFHPCASLTLQLHQTVGSRTGAMPLRFSLACCSPFPLKVPQYPNRKLGSSPASSNPAGCFPALGFPVGFVSRVMRPIPLDNFPSGYLPTHSVAVKDTELVIAILYSIASSPILGFLLRRFLAGTGRASPVAQCILGWDRARARRR
jgi:hypothetical protein